MPKQKRKHYDDKFRASAVLMLEAEGYPDQKGAVTRVSEYTGVSRTVLRSWFHRTHNPPPDDVIQEKKAELTDLLKDLAYQLVAAMPSKLDEASMQQLATSLGIVIDKWQLLDKKPTERIEHDVTISDETRVERLNTLLDAARARRDGQPARTDD